MNKKKTIIAAIVLLLVFLVGGAIAYFTDKTDTVTNTFTVGKVDITLEEPTWDEKIAADENYNKKLMPGAELEKDPTVTVAADSANAYVFVKVQVPCVGTGTLRRELFTYEISDEWSELTGEAQSCEDNAVAIHVYAHNDVMEAEDTSTLFSAVVLDEDLTQEEAEGLDTIEMPINGYAIQEANVDGTLADIGTEHFAS